MAESDSAGNHDATEASAPPEAESTNSSKSADVREATAGSPSASLARDEREDADEVEAEAAEEAQRHGPPWLPLAIAIGLPVVFFFVLPPLTKSGLWDPHELNVADLARRVALNLHGAANLALEGADNSLPHLNDLGRPQLPFTSMALGFKLFGLHEWAGRVPLALWGVLGVVATYGFVSRLIDRRAGVFSAVALTTMPLYFVQARTMLGDIALMSALAMSFGGLLVAAIGRGPNGEPDLGARVGWLGVGVLGLVAGFFTRGGLLGLALPCLAVGASYLLSIANAATGERDDDALSRVVGFGAALGGVVFAYLGLSALSDKSPDLNPWIGAMLRPPGKYPTFDFMIGHIASSLAPWSAFAPFAFGRLFIAPVLPASAPAARFSRESRTRMAVIVGAGLAFVIHGWMAPRTDLVAFAAPALVAAACGIALRDYERGAHPSVAVGVGTAVLLGTFHHELHNLPEKAFNAFAVMGAAFPEGFKQHALSVWTAVLIGFAGIAFLAMVERPGRGAGEGGERAVRKPFEPENYLRALIALRDAWDGLLALAYFALVAGASLAGLGVWLGTRNHAKWLPAFSSQTRDLVLNAWWVTAFVPLAIIFGTFFWADVALWAFRKPAGRISLTRGFEPFEELAARLRSSRLGDTVPRFIMGKLVVTKDQLEDGIGPTALFILAPLLYLQVPAIVFLGLRFGAGLKALPAAAVALPSGVAAFLALAVVADLLRGSRAGFLALGGVVGGAILCGSYYPALANQLSPKEVFESYQRMHKNGEPLALFGVGGRTAAYYAGGQPQILRDANQAYDWLMSGEPGQRHFLAVRAEELGRLNRAYREHARPPQNVPVLDDRSSQIILVASSLRDGEKNGNPLENIVLSSPPKPQRKLEANLEDKLQVLGYDMTDLTGHLVDHIAPGKKYHMRTYFKVLSPIQTEWEMFIHIDGFHRRHNGDHKICQGKYPMSLWLPDDVLVDDYEFTLEPNFSPGPYTVYFGLFVGETRLKVTSGSSDGENRIDGGSVRVQ